MGADLEKTIEEIHSKLDIVEVISGYIPLKKAGRNFKGLCPFHHEKTSSFIVSSTKQIYHCFGCGVGGDMISFVMKQERLEFMEALRILADKANVQLPQFGGKASGYRRSLANTLHRVNEFCANYYNALLIGSNKAKEAREYLASRSLSAPAVSKFKLGYAPPAWDGLLKFAEQKGISNAVLEKAGLIIPGKQGSFYDRFRSRVIFPIFDIRSKIIGFGGRVLDEALPKYMNSPETDIYIKGRHLYGLNFALDDIKAKDFVVVVEGYFDLITPYQNGIRNIVATLGTALTVEQIRLIKRFTSNAVIIFDADEAGEAASLRGLDLLVSEGLNVRIARLPEGVDPDTFIRGKTAADFLKVVETADNLFDYKLKLLIGKFNPAEAEEKARISSEMLPTIKRVENAVLRSDYIKKLAEVLFVKEEALMEEFSKIKLDYSYLGESRVLKESRAIRPAEKIIIGLMIEAPEMAEEVRGNLTIEDFKNEEIRAIIKTAFTMLDESKTLTAAKIIHRLNDDNLSQIICESLAETENLIEREKSLNDCILRVKTDNLKLKRERLTGLIKEAETKGDEGQLMKLVRELNSLRPAKL